MSVSRDELLARRFFHLNVCVALVLLVAIVGSIFQFGVEAWKGQRQVGLILPGGKADMGWNSAHYRGMKAACDSLGYDLVLRENVPEDAAACREAIQSLVEKRAKVIFLTNISSLDTVSDVVREYPNIRFFGIGTDSSETEVHRYAVRYVEPFYLAGVLAGLRTKTGRVGYVAPYSDPVFNQCVNAFVLGVQKVRPDAQVFLAWTGGWENPANGERAVWDFKAASVDVLGYMQDGDTLPLAADRAGIHFISLYGTYPSSRYGMAAITVDWKKAYSNMLRQYSRHFDHAAYWATCLDRSVDITARTEALTSREWALFESEHWEVLQGKLVFTGEIYDRDGGLRCGAGESVSNQSLSRMNWLVKGVRFIGN